MSKLLTYVGAGLLLALGLMTSLYIKRGTEIMALQGEKSFLIGKTSFLEMEIAKRNEKAVEADKRLREIETAAEESKEEGVFVWDNPLPDDVVTLRLRQD